MNALTAWIESTGIEELDVMNRLQEQGGIIADNCVRAADVAPGDAERAVAWLEENE